MKHRYNEEFARKDTLETKANNIITIAGTIATLLFGFGTFLVDKLGSKYGLIFPISVPLADIYNIVCLGIKDTKIRIRNFPIVFYKDGAFYNDRINRFEQYQDDEICSVMIKNYLMCNEKNHQINSSNASKIKKSQICFVIGISSIPIIVFILLIALPTTSGTILPVK